jgi:putative hydrolase of the HAD superfamily
MLKTIVFDLDDTLFPEESYILSGFRAVARWVERQLGIPCERSYTQILQLFREGGHGHTFDAWLELHGLRTETLVRKLIEVYRSHDPELSPYPEVPEVLSALVECFRLGLVSDGFFEVQRKKWKALNLTVAFSGIVFSDQWGRNYWKPDCRPFREVLRLCDSDGPEALYVGDNPEKDFLGAKQVGMSTVRIRRPEGVYSQREPPSPEYAPHIEISHLGQLKNVIRSSFNSLSCLSSF